MQSRSLALAAALAALLAASPAALAQVNAKSAGYHDDARKQLQKGDVKAAIIQLKNAVRADPGNIEARFDLGVAELRAGDPVSAEKDLAVARERGFDEARIVVPLGEALARQNKSGEILKQIQPGARGPEIEARVLSLRAGAFAALRQPAEAQAAYNESIKLSPTVAAYAGLARTLIAQRQFGPAEEQIDAALAREPNNAEALLIKGQLRRVAQDYAAAAGFYDRSVAAEPRSVRARLERVDFLISQNQADKAGADVDAVLAAAPRNNFALYYKALIAARANKLDSAAQTLQTLPPEFVGSYQPAQYLGGVVAYQRGQYAQAEDQFRRILGAFPGHLQSRKLLGSTYLQMNEPERALATLQPALLLAPDDPQLLGLMGTANLRLGRFADAVDFFDRGSDAAPDNQALRTQLAVSHLQLGQSEQAIKELESTLGRDPKMQQASVLLILAHVRNRDFDKAAAAVADLRAQQPDSPLADYYLGTVNAAKGDLAKSRDAFNAALQRQGDFFPARIALARVGLLEQNFDEARKQYEQALAKDDKNLQALLGLADLARRQNKPAEAATWLERAVQANPKSPAPRLQLVEALIERKDGVKAMATAREMTQAFPNNVAALDSLARAQLAAGEPASAAATYRQIINQTPNSAAAYHRLAGVQVASKDDAGARRSLTKAIEVEPGYLPAYQELVALEMRVNGADAALKTAGDIRRRQPNQAIGDLLVADVQFAAGRYGAAAEAFSAALQKQPAPAVVMRLSESYKRAGDAKRAHSTLDDWIAKNPADAQVRLVRAMYDIELGRTDVALKEHEELHAAYPNDPAVLNNLAWLLQNKDKPRALELAERAYKLAPTSPAIADTLGWMLVERGDNARAVTLLKDAAANAGGQPQIRYHYAVALNNTGQRDEARRILEELTAGNAAFESVADARKLLDDLKRN